MKIRVKEVERACAFGPGETSEPSFKSGGTEVPVLGERLQNTQAPHHARIKQETIKGGLRLRRPLGSDPEGEMKLYFGFADPFPGNGICSLTVVLGRCFVVPSLTKRSETELRSPILLCGFLLIKHLSISLSG